MAKYSVVITSPAKSDLSGIFAYVSNELLEPKLADKLIDKIESAVLSLEDMPKRINLVDDDRLAQQGIRHLLVENYMVFFRIHEHNKTVVVVRILYTRRDWLNIL